MPALILRDPKSDVDTEGGPDNDAKPTRAQVRGRLRQAEAGQWSGLIDELICRNRWAPSRVRPDPKFVQPEDCLLYTSPSPRD
eukprot:10006801-Alexandrium_andersonii.AAC.1